MLLQDTKGSGYVWIYAIILLAVVVYTIFQLKRQVGEVEDKRKSQLKKRFKKGEISRETYEAEKKELEL